MSCALYNTNGFGCGGCCHFNKSTAITLSGTVLQITIPDQVITNKEYLCVALCQSIPNGVTASTTTQLIVNGTKITLITPCGNNVYASQLRSRKVLHINVATDTTLGVVSKNSFLCAPTSGFPIINPPATASASTAVAEPATQSTAVVPVVTGGTK